MDQSTGLLGLPTNGPPTTTACAARGDGRNSTARADSVFGLRIGDAPDVGDEEDADAGGMSAAVTVADGERDTARPASPLKREGEADRALYEAEGENDMPPAAGKMGCANEPRGVSGRKVSDVLESDDDDVRAAGRLGVASEVGVKGTWFMSSASGMWCDG